MSNGERSVLVVSAHAGDFVWRAGGAIASATRRGERAVVVCLSYGERGESASAWRAGKGLEEIKAMRRSEAEAAAKELGAEVRFLDAGDYPLVPSHDLTDALVRIYREVVPDVVLTHPLADPYNGDHPVAAQLALQARVLAQAIGYDAPGDPLGAPPVFFFEPHQVIIAHMFVYYFGVLADITPPVCLAAYAASGIAQSNPLRTGVQASRIGLSGFIVPYMFLLSPELLLQDATWVTGSLAALTAFAGIFLLGVAVVGFIDRKLNPAVRVVLAACGLMLLHANPMVDVVGIVVGGGIVFWQWWTGPRARRQADRADAAAGSGVLPRS